MTRYFHTKKAYNNPDFLNSQSSRLIRINCEYEEPRMRLHEYGIDGATIFFGSARSKSNEDRHRHLRALELGMPRSRVKEYTNKLQQLDKESELTYWHDKTQELAYRLTAWDMKTHGKQKFPVCSGAGPGMMKAANQGAYEAGGISIGFGISLPFEQANNQYVTPELDFEFHYFFMRKFWLMTLAKGIVVSPGGVGTMDEIFEFLTLRQTGKINKDIPAVFFGKDFWDDIINFEALKDWGVISDDDDEMFLITNSVDEAMDYLTQRMDTTPAEY